MTYIKRFLLNKLLASQFQRGDESMMDFNYIEKRLFTYLLLFSCLVALMVSLISSLLSLSRLYFMSLGFSEQWVAVINVAIAASFVAINALVINTCLRCLFQKRNKKRALNALPKMMATCVSEFVKGYNELEA